MFLSEAKNILKNEYLKNYGDANDYGRYFMDEKISHSYQVLGAGNFLLNHEKIFKYSTDTEKDRLQATLLLHDVGRFYEAKVGASGICIDHGVYGAEILKNLVMFDRDDVLLPVRHHGHLIQSFLDDSEYQSLPSDRKKEIEKILFLVMDADKIANFYLLAREFPKIKNLFFPETHKGKNPNIPSEKVVQSYMKHELVNRKDVNSWADQALMFVACVYDLHYQSSFVFLDNLNIMPRLLKHIQNYWRESDAEIFISEVEQYVAEKRLQKYDLAMF